LVNRKQKKTSQILGAIYITLRIRYIQSKNKQKFKLQKHMKKVTEESANINPGPRKETFLHYCNK